MFFPARKAVDGPPCPSAHHGFSDGEKNIKFFPATMEQNIARVYLFGTPSVSSHLMAIVALVTISSIHLL
jgi:hypothetical protein